MGKYAKEFFSRSDFEFIEYPKTYFRLLTLDEVKKWLIRDKWTISEAAALFCGFNPLNFDPDPWMTFTPDEQERKDKYDWMYEYLQKKGVPNSEIWWAQYVLCSPIWRRCSITTRN